MFLKLQFFKPFNENLLVAILLYLITIPCGIKNQDILRPVEQSSSDIDKQRQKKPYPEDVPNSVGTWFGSGFEISLSISSGQTNIRNFFQTIGIFSILALRPMTKKTLLRVRSNVEYLLYIFLYHASKKLVIHIRVESSK